MLAKLSQTPQINPLHELQKRYAICELSGAFYAVDLDKLTEPETSLSLYKRVDANVAFKRLLEALPVYCDSKDAIAQFWVSPNTTVYDKIAFSPTPTSATTLNLWVDPTVTPKAGKPPSLVLKHLKSVVCADDDIKYEYLINYLAHMLQKPEQKPGVMLVMVGEQGSGKGVTLKLIRRIFEGSSSIFNNIEHIVGNFNSALERLYVVMLDEALFAGDKKSTDRMKSLITEDVIRIEAKHQPSRQIRSYHRFIATTNHSHFAHIDSGDRRHQFFFVSDSKVGDYEYFEGLLSEIGDDQALANLVYYLSNRDISKFRPASLPKDQQKGDQVLRSLTGFDEFYYSRLLTGKQVGDSFSCWNDEYFASTDSILDGYKNYMKGRARLPNMNTQATISKLRELCPSGKKHRMSGQGGDMRGWKFPGIEGARADFSRVLKIKIEWGD